MIFQKLDAFLIYTSQEDEVVGNLHLIFSNCLIQFLQLYHDVALVIFLTKLFREVLLS